MYIDDEDPLIAELIKDVCNKHYDRFNVKSLGFINDDTIDIELFKIPNRNDTCWCNSNIKYKHCHMRNELNEHEKDL
jgi:hypothetical protein